MPININSVINTGKFFLMTNSEKHSNKIPYLAILVRYLTLTNIDFNPFSMFWEVFMEALEVM